MGLRGPAGKSVAELKLHGTYRKDRHLKRESLPTVAAALVKPTGMTKRAGDKWNQLLPLLVAAGHVNGLDSEVLAVTCDVWSLYCAARTLAAKQPTDDKARGSYIAYFKAYTEGLKRLGLSPLDRSRLVGPATTEAKDKTAGIAGFARKRV